MKNVEIVREDGGTLQNGGGAANDNELNLPLDEMGQDLLSVGWLVGRHRGIS